MSKRQAVVKRRAAVKRWKKVVARAAQLRASIDIKLKYVGIPMK